MAKKTTAPAEAVEAQNETGLQIATDFKTLDFNNVDQMLEALEEQPNEALTLDEGRQNLIFEAGDELTMLFEGCEERTFDDGVKLVANFTQKGGAQAYCGNVFLVNRLKHIEAPNYVRIICTGEEKGKSGGKFKTFEIYRLK